jgi:hypothetical protein
MTVDTFRWLVTPGCGIAALLLIYDMRRVLRPRIAGEQPWRETRILGLAILILGAFVLDRGQGSRFAFAIEAVLVLAVALLVLSWVSLTRLVATVLRYDLDDRPPEASCLD